MRASALVLLALAITLGACGGSDNRNKNRPPVPINVSVQIGSQKLTASPAKFGAGPITLLVANQSGASQTVTIDGPQLKQSVGPINPEDTATLKVSVQPGAYTLATDQSAGLRPVRLDVGAKRPSGQNTLLLP
ncbi:MAG: hypothetical protein C5B48_14140 [Candidatus Rokuibacteriota bacterium]|nr:MAG: hypothetical protein C5B48_14140 [Candidatus Rokubacteria bacterium]